MTDDIVARLRVWSRWLDERVPDSAVGDDLREAADEIERLRGQIEHHARDRIEYCAAWSKWIEENDGLEIAQWCRAYADAVPYPNPDGPEIVRVIHSRLDARHRMAADEIERLRADYKLYGVEDPFHATNCHPQRKQEDTQDDRER